jgi:hypothetical protein
MIMMRTKPTNYEAAKALVAVNEEVTVPALVGRLLDAGRREMPTKRELSAKMMKDRDFIVIEKANGRTPTVFQRIN